MVVIPLHIKLIKILLILLIKHIYNYLIYMIYDWLPTLAGYVHEFLCTKKDLNDWNDRYNF